MSYKVAFKLAGSEYCLEISPLYTSLVRRLLTVTVEVQVAVLPQSSVAVNFTVNALLQVAVPISASVKVYLSSDRLRLASQISFEPLFKSAAVIVTEPPAPSVTLTLLQIAFGGVLSLPELE